MGMQTNKPKNLFIEKLKKFVGKEVKVVFFNPQNEEEYVEGICESLDFVQRTVIIRTKEKKILIPRYKYLERLRTNPDE